MADKADSDQSIELFAEAADVTVERVGSQRVVLRSETRTEAQLLTADLQDVRVEISRVAVGRDVDSVPDVRVDGDLTVFPVMEERVVLHRQLVLKEEVHVRRIVETRRAEFQVDLRSEHAVVDRIDTQTGEVLQQDHLTAKGTDR
jgi:stress response protein YsnF